jgi:hypothetical protein
VRSWGAFAGFRETRSTLAWPRLGKTPAAFWWLAGRTHSVTKPFSSCRGTTLGPDPNTRDNELDPEGLFRVSEAIAPTFPRSLTPPSGGWTAWQTRIVDLIGIGALGEKFRMISDNRG